MKNNICVIVYVPSNSLINDVISGLIVISVVNIDN